MNGEIVVRERAGKGGDIVVQLTAIALGNVEHRAVDHRARDRYSRRQYEIDAIADDEPAHLAGETGRLFEDERAARSRKSRKQHGSAGGNGAAKLQGRAITDRKRARPVNWERLACACTSTEPGLSSENIKRRGPTHRVDHAHIVDGIAAGAEGVYPGYIPYAAALVGERRVGQRDVADDGAVVVDRDRAATLGNSDARS